MQRAENMGLMKFWNVAERINDRRTCDPFGIKNEECNMRAACWGRGAAWSAVTLSRGHVYFPNKTKIFFKNKKKEDERGKTKIVRKTGKR